MRTFATHVKRHAVGYLALSVALGGTAYAAPLAARGPSEIRACYTRHGGALRVLRKGQHCKKRETAIAWNRQGVAGSEGTPGAPGTAGTAATTDGAPAVPSLRTLGAGAVQAAAGNDPRLSDARPPTGPAGGVLTGTYPSPAALAVGSVGSSQIATDAVGGAEIRSTVLSYDPSSVPAQGCVEDFVTVSGVIPNTPVLLIAMTSLPSGVFVANAHGSTNNSVRVRLCNVTAAASDPPSNTFSATVL
jgi:hypothetical protein